MSTAARATPSISVIVPVYNVADHVTACLDSLRAQVWQDFEVLVIDDGSTDDSNARAAAAIADDPRFTLIRQDNRGLSGARNTGLEHAKGALIAFVDSDDRVTPDYLSRLKSALDDTGADWVACAVHSCFPDGSGHSHSAIHGAAALADHPSPRRYGFRDWSDVICHFPSAWNKLYRRSLIEGLWFDEGTWFEDHSFFQRAAARTDHILHLPEPLYLQTRGRPGQITTQDSDRIFEQFDVLTGLREIMQNGDRPGADQGFAHLTTRLLFERSIALKNHLRRTEFAQKSALFLQEQGVTYSPDWDPEIGHSWALEMAGDDLLSVILPWDGVDVTALEITLDSLHAQDGPGCTVLVICPNASSADQAQIITAARPDLNTTVDTQTGRGVGDARSHGLHAVQSRFVTFVNAGDVLHPSALLAWVEAMLRDAADMGISHHRLAPDHPGGQPHPLHAFHCKTPPPGGALTLDTKGALSLSSVLSARIFRRAFLLEQGLKFTSGPRSGWALMLQAACAGQLTHIPWPGVDTAAPTKPRGLPLRRISRGHDTLLAALPTEITTQFPEGWQRRLYARALSDEIRRSAPMGRAGKALILGHAILGAMRRGLAGVTPLPAGLDDLFGPRSRLLLDPAGLAGALLRRPRGHSAYDRQQALDTALQNIDPPDPADRLMRFPLHRDGLVRLRAHFHREPFLNIFFFAADRMEIPFHLSLRQAEGTLVCNARGRDGAWGREQILPMALPAHGTEVTLRITPPQTTVHLDGAEVFRFENAARRGFGTPQDIAYLGFQGLAHVHEVRPAPTPEQLTLDDRLILRAQETALDHQLITGTGETLPLLPTADDRDLFALLPGRLWRDLPREAPLQLQLTSTTGTPVAPPLEMTRADMAHRLSDMLEDGLPTTDSTLALTVLEHIRHGALMPLMSPKARASAHHIATFYGASEFLVAGDTTEATTPQAPPARDPLVADIDAARARFSISQRQPAPLDPATVLANLPQSPEARRATLMALCESFCMEGQDFDALFALFDPATMAPFVASGEPWHDSTLLPFLLRQGEFDSLRHILTSLIPTTRDGWVVTPAIAWITRQALHDGNLPPDAREAILRGYMDFVDQRLSDYWQRAHCHALTGAAVDLVLAGGALPGALTAADITAFVLRGYGLSRQFWEMLDNDADLPADLQTARDHFAVIRNATDGHAIEQALIWFEGYDAPDIARLRRELLGPAGVALSSGETLNAAALPSIGDDDAASDVASSTACSVVRHMASPDAGPVSAEVSQMAAGALPRLVKHPLEHARNYPRAPHLFDQQAASRTTMATFATPPNTQELAQLLDSYAPLATPASKFIGFALGLTLFSHLSETKAPADLRTQVGDWLRDAHARLSDTERADLARAPALRMGLLRFAATTPESDLAQQLLNGAQLPAPGDPSNSGLPAGNPLFDTIVTVFSCRAYLDNRIPALRDGWLSQLEALGIPYVIIVGDGDGTRHGDVVHVDAADDYEGLPQKALAAIRWVHDNTRYTHMLKIDDDCFVNAPLFFESLNYRKFDYFGRRLHRDTGQTDRLWHQEKSTTPRGRMDLDRSPEPSTYADGGSGYALSRSAMAAILSSADSAEGQQILQTSFMEDKLVGDLLALRGITLSQESYLTSTRRRTFGAATPVPYWNNGFYPSQSAPVMQVHMDTHLDQPEAMARLDKTGLWPRKIWPSFQQVRLGYQSNALELISPEHTVAAARAAEVAVVACMRNEMFILPHFLAHYRRLGVGAFLIADNASDDGTREYLLEQPDVALFSVDTDYNQSHYGVAWQQAMLAQFRVGKWSLVADADELLVWQRDQRQTLPELLATPEFAEAEAARVFMLDMYPQGPLEEVDFASGDPFAEAGFCDATPFLENWPGHGPFSNQPTWTSALRHRLIPGSRPDLFVAQKIALMRYHPWMRLSAGLHFVGDVKLSKRELIFGHFKYNADFRSKAQTEVSRGQHFNDAEEYRKYLALASEGRSVIHDPDISVRWYQSPAVAARLRD